MKREKSSGKGYLKIFLLVVCILIAYKILFNFSSLMFGINLVLSILSPFITGFVLAYFINIPCFWLERGLLRLKPRFIKKASRQISVVLCIVLIIAACVFAAGSLIPMLYESLSRLISALPGFVDQTLEYLATVPLITKLGLDHRIDELIQPQSMNNLFSDLNLTPVSSTIQFATGLFSGIFSFVLAVISTVYFLFEYNNMKTYIKRLVNLISNPKKQTAVLKYIHITDNSFRKFISCQILDCLILGTIATVALFVLRSPYALVLGIMLGAVNIVPYFGAIIGSIMVVIMMLFTNGFESAVITAIVLLIIQQLDGNFINPKIMGTSFKVSPVLIIIAITVGGAIGGGFGGLSGMIVGMVFAIPVVNVFKILLEEYMQEKEQSEKVNSKPTTCP